MTKEFPFPLPERCRSLSEHNPALPRLFFRGASLARCVAVTPKTGGILCIGVQICTYILACIPPIHVFGHFSQETSRDNRDRGSFEQRRDRLSENGGRREARGEGSKKRKKRKKQKTRCWSVWVKIKKAKLALLLL